jgi:hypothetical protein
MTDTITDLFGLETPIINYSKTERSPYKIWKAKTNYRKADGKNNCSNCKYSRQITAGMKTYRKCINLGETNSVKTDVSRKMVCNLHKERV